MSRRRGRGTAAGGRYGRGVWRRNFAAAATVQARALLEKVSAVEARNVRRIRMAVTQSLPTALYRSLPLPTAPHRAPPLPTAPHRSPPAAPHPPLPTRYSPPPRPRLRPRPPHLSTHPQPNSAHHPPYASPHPYPYLHLPPPHPHPTPLHPNPPHLLHPISTPPDLHTTRGFYPQQTCVRRTPLIATPVRGTTGHLTHSRVSSLFLVPPKPSQFDYKFPDEEIGRRAAEGGRISKP